MLALASGLGELPKPELDPEVKVVQRAQLVAAMEAMLQEGTAAGGGGIGTSVPEQRTRGKGAHRAVGLRKLKPRSRLSKGIAAGGLTVGVAAGAFSGVAAASSDALPGDSLYGLKRGMEDLKLGMADDDADRGEIYLDQASTRLKEARRLMERGRSGAPRPRVARRGQARALRHAARRHRGPPAAPPGVRAGRLARPHPGPVALLRSHRSSWSDLRGQLPVQLATWASRSARSSTP